MPREERVHVLFVCNEGFSSSKHASEFASYASHVKGLENLRVDSMGIKLKRANEENGSMAFDKRTLEDAHHIIPSWRETYDEVNTIPHFGHVHDIFLKDPLNPRWMEILANYIKKKNGL